MVDSMSQQANQEPEVQDASPEMKREIEAYSSGLINMVYDKKTSAEVYEMLKSAPPEQSIPHATLTINSRMEEAIRGAGQKPKLGVILNANMALIQELLTVGTEGGFFEVAEEQIPAILQTAMKSYIQDGLKKKTIDPVELQQALEPLMDEETKSQANIVGEQMGVPKEPGVDAAMETYAGQREGAQKQQMLQQQEAQARQSQGQLQQAAGGQA